MKKAIDMNTNTCDFFIFLCQVNRIRSIYNYSIPRVDLLISKGVMLNTIYFDFSGFYHDCILSGLHGFLFVLLLLPDFFFKKNTYFLHLLGKSALISILTTKAFNLNNTQFF